MAEESEGSSLVGALGDEPVSEAVLRALGDHAQVERVTPRAMDTDPETGEVVVTEFLVQLSERALAVRYDEDGGYRVVASGSTEEEVGEALAAAADDESDEDDGDHCEANA
jgi:hypothetical protein